MTLSRFNGQSILLRIGRCKVAGRVISPPSVWGKNGRQPNSQPVMSESNVIIGVLDIQLHFSYVWLNPKRVLINNRV